jgi:hypothetical protein
MTKKELDLVQAFTAVETAWARIEYYNDQESVINEIDDALKEFKTLFYDLITEEETE